MLVFQYLRRATHAACLPAATRLSRRFSMSRPVLELISDAIKDDHRRIENAYRQVIQSKTMEDRESWQNQLTWMLAVHVVGEEMLVYPQFERYLINGKDMADRDRVEHKIIKDHLYKFQSLPAADANLLPTLQILWKNLSSHIQIEEKHDLAALENKLTKNESMQMAAAFGRTKCFLPTRCHPESPDKPPYETVVGLLAAPLDRLQDFFRKFP